MWTLSYSPSCAERTADDLCRISHADLRECISRWLSDNTFTDVTESVYTVKQLMAEHHMTYPAAIIFIDWYREDPVAASSVLKSRM